MIEKMTHVAMLAPAAEKDRLLAWLYGERRLHVMPLGEKDERWDKSFAPLPDETQAKDGILARINSVVAFCREHASDKPGFLDAMLPLKTVGGKDELDAAVREADVPLLHDKTNLLRANIESANEDIARLKMNKAAIEQFAFIGDDLPKLTRLRNMTLEVVSVSGQGGKAFLLDKRIAGGAEGEGAVVAEQIFADQTHAYYALATPATDAETLKSLIDDHGLHVQAVPKVEQGAAKEISFLNDKLREADIVLSARLREANEFADRWLRKASLAAGQYETEKNLAAARPGMAASSHIFVARGYLKTEDVAAFRARLEESVPGASLMECDAPAPAKAGEEAEEPPVSMKWNKWIAPAGLLAKMYGTPSYKSIDPTPYVASIFFIFVGICLGDAVYGLLLVGIMAWLKKKYREQAHLVDFFQAFTYCGIAAVIVGFFTGSWLGDLTSIVPGMGWADAIRVKFALIDPIKDSQLALYIAVGIGVATQIYGMALRAHRDWRRGDKMGAFSDGILWICFLVFAILAGATGASLFWILFVLSCVLLVLTQGREQKGIVARILVGLVALYGIVGAYGASAILGDLISYARLMALCLTGAALGSTFNMLGKLSADIPAVGIIIGILLVAGGHLMSFFLNLLGGFVHSARLIMLEFFGRFYEAGGTAYRPYGFDSATVDVKSKK